jgi:hypothetical protein
MHAALERGVCASGLQIETKKKLLPLAVNLVLPLAKFRAIVAGFAKKPPHHVCDD